MSSASKPTLESTVTRYRREASRNDGSNVELEVRLQGVDYSNFSAIYEALLAKRGSDGKPCAVDDGALTMMVSTIMYDRPDTKERGEGGPRNLRPARIQEIFFEKGVRSRTQHVRKAPLLIPFRVPNSDGLSYIVALAAECVEADGEKSFVPDESAVIRAKARVSFNLSAVGSSELKPKLLWRIDMTVTRQIMGSDAQSSIGHIVTQMFRTTPHMTPQNFLRTLCLDNDANPAPRELYRYEVEAEFIGPVEFRDAIRPLDVTTAAEAIMRLANPEYVREAAMQAEVYRVAQYIVKAPGYLRRFQHELGLKRLLPSARAITRAEYRAIYPPKGLFLTDKADGKRAVAIAHDGHALIISDALHEGYKPVGPVTHGDTIVDAELIVDETDTPTALYAFDVIAVGGEDVSQDGFEKRVGRLEEAVDILRNMGLPIFAKQYEHLLSDEPADLERAVRLVHEAKRPYEIDGLIFVEPGKPYDETANSKWKSARDNTIDFLARRAPASVLGKAPFIDAPGHKLYFFFVGINPEMYDALGLMWCPGYSDLFGGKTGGGRRRQATANSGSYHPIQFSPSDAPLAYLYQHPDESPFGDINGKIVEARCAGDCDAAGGRAQLVNWVVTRIREDRRRELLTKRYFGNDFYTAEMIWLNYIDPFPIEQLWDGPGLDYFMHPKSGAFRAQTAVISFVKTQRINSLKHSSWVVDIGAGKGQDLGRYLDAEVQHLVAVDRDRAALSELVRRKYSFAKRSRGNSQHGNSQRGNSKRTATTIHVLVADASDPHTNTLNKFEQLGLIRATADAVVCNLAVHYFLGSVASMRNFVALARGAVKVGGQVILTMLIGKAVHAAFGNIPAGETWDIFEGDAGGATKSLKYSLKRLYSSETLEAAGQRIGVLLPFSDGNYYEEFLVNTDALTAEFAARGFTAEGPVSVADSIPKFEARNRALAGSLSAGDREYLALYGEMVFTRVK